MRSSVFALTLLALTVFSAACHGGSEEAAKDATSPSTAAVAPTSRAPATGSKEPGGESPPKGSAVRRIAYINDGECGGGLYVVNSDGGRERLIADGLLTTLSWTPDGQRLAFVNDEGLQIIDTDGKNVHLLVQFPRESYLANDAHFSPDGDHIAFVRNFSVYVVKEDGTGETELMEGRFLGWSRDSKSVFIRFTLSVSTDKGVVRPDSGQIFSVPIDRPGDRRLLFQLQAGEEVALSPDGTKVAQGSLSPDGTKVAGVGREGPSPVLWVSNVDGSDRRQVISGDVNDHFSPPVWSPDGSQIALWAGGGVDVVNVDGSGRKRISPEGENKRCPGSQPVWQP